MADVLVLNAGDVPLHRESVKHAITMLVRPGAMAEGDPDGRIFGPYPLPHVLRLPQHDVVDHLVPRPRAIRRGRLATRHSHRVHRRSTVLKVVAVGAHDTKYEVSW